MDGDRRKDRDSTPPTGVRWRGVKLTYGQTMRGRTRFPSRLYVYSGSFTFLLWHTLSKINDVFSLYTFEVTGKVGRCTW